MFHIDDQSFFEQVLLQIRGMAITYSSLKKKEAESRKKELEDSITRLENLRHDNVPANPNIEEQLQNLKNEQEVMRKEYIKGVFVRTRANWIEEGEKPTKYFLSLEKRHYVNKTVAKLVNSDNSTISKQEDILSAIESFYKQLYSSKDIFLDDVDLDTVIEKDNVNILKEDMSSELEGKLTYQEASFALKNMKNNTSPGSDGYTVEFFKFFWKDIGIFLIRAINEGYNKGELSITQKQGIISILPKGDKPREFI